MPVTQELSEDARVLLGYICCLEGDRCIGQKNGEGDSYVIPSPHHNWDGRMNLGRVLHPESLQELVDQGLLTTEEQDAFNADSDYSSIGIGGFNRIFVLTEAGRVCVVQFVLRREV